MITPDFGQRLKSPDRHLPKVFVLPYAHGASSAFTKRGPVHNNPWLDFKKVVSLGKKGLTSNNALTIMIKTFA
jgi:hypothetical protein